MLFSFCRDVLSLPYKDARYQTCPQYRKFGRFDIMVLKDVFLTTGRYLI